MNVKHHPSIRLTIALFTALLLLLALPVLLFAFIPADNAGANWFDFQPGPDDWQNATTIQTSVTVTDSDGLSNQAAYRYATDGLGWSGWMTADLQIGGGDPITRNLTVTAVTLDEGENFIQYVITDAMGTAEFSPQATIHIDTTPPASPDDLQLTPTGWQTASDVSWTATWRNPDDLSGIVAACYKMGTAPVDSNDGQCVSGDDIETITDILPVEEGGYDFYLWLKDAAGNSDAANAALAADGIQWDATPPSVYIDVFGHIGENNWYTDTVTVQINAADGESGIARKQYNLDQQGWVEGDALAIDQEGEHSIVARAFDVAGNSTETSPRAIKLDDHPPTTTIAIQGTPNAQGWYETPVTVTLQAEDGTSGVDATQWRTGNGVWRRQNPAVLETDGQHTFQYYSTDHAGNAEPVQEEPIWIDQFPPITSYAILSPDPPNNGWYRQPVTITLVAVDDGIGVDKTYYRINGGDWNTGDTFRLIASGNYDIEFYSVDLLGRTEAVSSIPDGVHIDTAPPRSPTPLDVQPQRWTNVNDFTLTMAISPDLSGIAGAYVKVGEPPLTPTDGDWHPGSTNTLTNIEVPGEGAFRAYVWLQDNAGNVDHGNYGVWEGDLSLKYDVSPPVTQLAVTGDLGKNGWYTSPISVTLLPTDTLSGPAETIVQLDDDAPMTTTVLYLDSQDKHTLRYFSTDHAGNQEQARLATLSIDYEAPGSPMNLAVEPHDWTLTNTFTLTWDNPQDISGIGAAYYTLGSPPSSPEDGIRISPTGVASGISVPGEGAWDVYLWLEDRAGNSDISSRVLLREGMRYDITPPTSVFTILEGTPNEDGWFGSPVKILISPSDDGSGPAGVRYRFNDEDWQFAEHEALIEINRTGHFDLAYQAVDVAGNWEPVQHAFLKVDVDAPQTRFLQTDRYQRQTNFMVSWTGADQSNGSGLQGFDLQSKDGRNGAWVFWGTLNTPETSGRYYGNYGHRYFFRIRARDAAGNVSDWVEMPWGVYIDRLQDGDFAGGDFGLWQHGGALAQSVIAAPGPYDDAPVNVAQLGTPDYGPNNDFGHPGTIPVGSAAITQTVRIPGASVLDRPTLSFWYRIRTYDAEYSERFEKFYDTLDVRLSFGDNSQLVFRDGQPYDQWQENQGKELADLGWKHIFIPIPRNLIDEMIAISFENWNRNDNYLNTWTQVTDIRVWEPYQVFLPQLMGGSEEPVGPDEADVQLLHSLSSPPLSRSSHR